ncbi:MAG TPA: exosome complex RNA-binding protein Csl4 [Candidatus Thermoplasmatota archaeon]|nr:exosome complex RNA-binding protein Csl4 [Candidatus Thermoplasmatota archaeon]
MTKTDKKLVFPGDVLATSEELLPGPGSHDDGTNVVATRIGQFEVEPNEMRAVVKPLTSVPPRVRMGDYVLGQVMMIKPAMAGVEVLAVEDEPRVIPGDTNGTLHVSKIAQKYVRDVGEEYRLGDVIRARVLSVKPSIQLTTDEQRCGCIKALCLRCRKGLNKVGRGLECPNCGRREMRNIAPDYGQVKLPEGLSVEKQNA